MKRQWGFGAGSASILTIFVLLCLTTFATLSTVSALADFRLTRRTTQSVTDYYVADALATEQLAVIDGLLNEIDETLEPAEYFAACRQRTAAQLDGLTFLDEEGLTIGYDVAIDERRSLQVKLKIIKPAATGRRWELLSWKSTPSEEWVEEDPLNLWPGQDGDDGIALAGLPPLEGV